MTQPQQTAKLPRPPGVGECGLGLIEDMPAIRRSRSSAWTAAASSHPDSTGATSSTPETIAIVDEPDDTDHRAPADPFALPATISVGHSSQRWTLDGMSRQLICTSEQGGRELGSADA
jgi:hypothetical protein